MKETDHDYQNYLSGNYHDGGMNFTRKTWNEFKKNWIGFKQTEYDDTYHFLFRFDIHKQDDENYRLELCFMLQKKGIYIHLNVLNITQSELDNEVREWLSGRKDYMDVLWKDVI